MGKWFCQGVLCTQKTFCHALIRVNRDKLDDFMNCHLYTLPLPKEFFHSIWSKVRVMNLLLRGDSRTKFRLKHLVLFNK